MLKYFTCFKFRLVACFYFKVQTGVLFKPIYVETSIRKKRQLRVKVDDLYSDDRVKVLSFDIKISVCYVIKVFFSELVIIMKHNFTSGERCCRQIPSSSGNCGMMEIFKIRKEKNNSFNLFSALVP